ncbi:MAG: hypothetical protein WD602_07595 [Actinomycetota bacterium]
MESDSRKIELDVPVARDRRKLFEQEAALAGIDPAADDLSSEEVPDDVESHLRRMREGAARRTVARDQE